MPNNKVKVAIPTDPTALLNLLNAVQTKHLALGASSPLAGLNWADITPDLAEATAKDTLSDDLYRQAEKATGDRDKLMPELIEAVRAARDILLGLNRANPDALGDYGFDVSDATAGAKKDEAKK